MSGANVSPIGRNKEEWFVQATDYRKLNQPLFLVSPYRAHIRSAHARLRPLRRLRGIFLMGAATPPLPRRGVRLLSVVFNAPVPSKRCGTCSAYEDGRLRPIKQNATRPHLLEGGAGRSHLQTPVHRPKSEGISAQEIHEPPREPAPKS